MQWPILIKQYKNYLRLERGMSDNSVEAYLMDVEKLYQFAARKEPVQSAKSISYKDLLLFIRFLDELFLSARSQARIISGIKSFYGFLIEEEMLVDDPTMLLETPKIAQKLPAFLSVAEIDLIFNAAWQEPNHGRRNRAMLEMLYSSGMRVSELVNLEYGQIMEEIGFLRVLGKGNKERFVPIGSSALSALKDYFVNEKIKVTPKVGHESYVFLNRRGAKLTRNMVFLIIQKAALDAQINKVVSPHTFRHSFATHLVENGADLRAVQQMLGHESITTTEIYTHLDRQFLKQTLDKYHPKSIG